ncbi:MAG: AmmeMemoRadiSam system protein B [Patescibacteria group bacterium]|nr:AmmeMemoRadiSam system protein B [Patescibacteria group bacterium]
MITFAALVPHPPILIPEIGKENTERLKKTITSYKKLELALKESQATTIFIISPHGETFHNTMLINQNIAYRADFSEFGYLGAKKEWRGNMKLTQIIKSACEKDNNLRLYTSNTLDHSTAIPLLLLTPNISNLKIIPLSYSQLNNKKHFEFGQSIGKILANTDERVAIIASGDLSHCLNKDAPAEYSPKGAKFDGKLKELLKNKKTADILALPPDFIESACESGLRSILILLGIINNFNYQPEILSYEAPFGVGYLSMEFKL